MDEQARKNPREISSVDSETSCSCSPRPEPVIYTRAIKHAKDFIGNTGSEALPANRSTAQFPGAPRKCLPSSRKWPNQQRSRKLSAQPPNGKKSRPASRFRLGLRERGVSTVAGSLGNPDRLLTTSRFPMPKQPKRLSRSF